MGGVIIKLGGALITDKDQIHTFRQEALMPLASILKGMASEDKRVTIVHGAGSFGHIEAKQAGLADGHDPERETEQTQAVDRVRSSMISLNGMVLDILREHGIDCQTHPPREWAKGTGSAFIGDISRFETPGMVHVTFGDVVDVDGDMRFGILSGDHLMERLALETDDMDMAVFLLNGIDGLYDKDPKDPDARLIREYNSEASYTTTQDSDKDVTGGMALKVDVSKRIASTGPKVVFVNGLDMENMRRLFAGEEFTGTVFKRAKSHE